MLQIVRLGAPRKKGEGLRIGAARRPPRGVKREDYARLDYYDVWLPELAPSRTICSIAAPPAAPSSAAPSPAP